MPSSRLRVAIAASFALAVVPLAHCSDNTVEATPSSGTIGPSGGALASSDYVIELLVPAGALSSDVIFTITPASAPGSGSVAPAYTISPPGTTFSAPAVISYTEQAITGTTFNDPSDYRVAAYGTSSWVPLANAGVDVLADTIEGTATVLSANPYSVIIPTGGTTCVTVSESCAEGDAGCSQTPCGPASPGKCAAYAGAVTQSCSVDDGSTAITVECCYPTGEPLCFTQSEPNGCESPCSQLPGSSALSCVPNVGPPLNDESTGTSVSTCCFASGAQVCVLAHGSGSCGSSTPCAGYPQGTSMTSCIDVSGGTEETCCLPAGVLPPTLPSGAAGDGGVVVTVGDAGADASEGTSSDAGPDGNGNGNPDASGDSDAGGNQGSDSGADSGTDAGDAG